MAGPITPGQADAQQAFDVYLSYNSRDRAMVERIAARLKRAGIEPWLDRWALTPGGDWQRELGAGLDACVACAVFIGAHDIGAWELQEVTVAIDRATTQRGFRVFPVLLPGVDEPFDPNRLPHFLRARTWVDFRDGRDDRRALQHLINAVKGVPFGPDVAVVRGDDTAPYKGLRVFGEEDARFFFGRDREIQRLLEKLKSNAFLAVLGPSGSGKSSLVRAGLVPELRAGALALDSNWRVCVTRPGAAPLTALAAQLVDLRPGEGMASTLDALGRDPRTLHLAVEHALAGSPPDDRVLVIVDQLEEVFTLCNDEAERRQLFATLLDATSATGGRTVVVVTMRADFYARCAAYPEFAQLVTAQQMLIGPIDADGLRQAIEEPARRVGLELEAGLSDTILADVAAEPGALPLLEHALLELWERRRGELLTLEGYREAGGVHGALAQRADQIFDGLSPDQRQIARRALLRLTQPGEGTEDTRRRATRSELATAAADAGFETVLGRLVDARMLTTGRDETGQEVVDVSHEALIRGWPRLRGWIDADRAGLLVHRRLTDASREWDTLGRDRAALYRGARLAAAREWAAEHADDLSPLEREFLGASEAAERREVETAARNSRRRRAVAGAIAVMAVVIAALVAFALTQRTDARKQSADARALTLAESSQALVGTRPDVSMLLGLAAYTSDPGVQEASSVLGALTTVRRTGVLAILHGHAGSVFDVAYRPDGRMLASASNDGTIRLWDAATHRQLGAPLSGGGPIDSVAFDRTGILASGGDDGDVRLWDVATHRQLGGPLAGDGQPVDSVAFSPDGTLASAGADGRIRLWDVATHTEIGAPLQANTSPVNRVVFVNGEILASGAADGAVRLWDVNSHRQLGPPLVGSGEAVYGLAASSDGTLAVGDFDGTVALWNAADRRPLGVVHAGSAVVDTVAFSPDGRTLASGSADPQERVTLWDVGTLKALGPPLVGQTNGIYGVAFSPDGRTLASASGDGTVWLWSTGARRPLGGPLPVNAGAVESVAFDRAGTTLAWGSADGTVRLWDVAGSRLRVPPMGGGAAVGTVAFSADGSTLASAGADTIDLWNAASGAPLGLLRGQTQTVDSVAFSPTGPLLASGSADGTVWIWNYRTHERVGRPFAAGGAPVDSVALSPDGRTLAAGGDDGVIRLWSLRTGELLGSLHGHVTGVTSVAFSPDGRTLASASYDNTVRLWDVATRRQLHLLIGPKRPVFSVAFSPDGRTLASASGDGTLRIWDVASGEPLGLPLTGNATYLQNAAPSVAFSADGRTLAAAGPDGTVITWDDLLWENPTELASQVCSLVGGGLSAAEWAQYAPRTTYQQTCR